MPMAELFNTVFEMKLHLLFVLAADIGSPMSIDKILAADFIAVYGKEFDISSSNLHGDNPYKYSEITAKRELLKSAVKEAILDGLADFLPSVETGMMYRINFKGISFCNAFHTSYAKEYQLLARSALEYLNPKTESEIVAFLNEKAITSIREAVSQNE